MSKLSTATNIQMPAMNAEDLNKFIKLLAAHSPNMTVNVLVNDYMPDGTIVVSRNLWGSIIKPLGPKKMEKRNE